MRSKIISRFAAGTFGVCFAYALIRQPFAVLKDPDAIKDWEETVSSVVIEATQPTLPLPSTTIPETLPAATLPETTAEQAAEPATGTAVTESPETTAEPQTTETAATEAAEEEPEDDDDSDKEEAEEEEQAQSSGQESGGDVPTLSQFLSQLTCGGCRHRCLLVNPRCMKGRATAESATVEYYEIYGA